MSAQLKATPLVSSANQRWPLVKQPSRDVNNLFKSKLLPRMQLTCCCAVVLSNHFCKFLNAIPVHEFALQQTEPVNCYNSVICSAVNQKLDSIFQLSGYQSEQPGLAVVCLGVIHAD